MRKIAGYLTKNRSGKDQKIVQSTHENEHIKPRKTFWRNSKQFHRFRPGSAKDSPKAIRNRLPEKRGTKGPETGKELRNDGKNKPRSIKNLYL